MFTLNWEQAAGRSSFSWQSWRQQRIQVPGESWTQSWWLYGSQSRRSQSPHKTWAFSTRKAVSNMKNQTQENYQTFYTRWIKGPPSLTSSDTNPCAKSMRKKHLYSLALRYQQLGHLGDSNGHTGPLPTPLQKPPESPSAGTTSGTVTTLN